jgi:hypothetical protein
MGYVSPGGAAALQRFRIDGARFTLERDDFAALPEASRALDLLYADRVRAASGNQTPPRTTSSLKGTSVSISTVKPTGCLAFCGPTPATKQCEDQAQAALNRCTSDWNRCIDNIGPAVTTDSDARKKCHIRENECENDTSLHDCVYHSEHLVEQIRDNFLGAVGEASGPSNGVMCREANNQRQVCIQKFQQLGLTSADCPTLDGC